MINAKCVAFILLLWICDDSPVNVRYNSWLGCLNIDGLQELNPPEFSRNLHRESPHYLRGSQRDLFLLPLPGWCCSGKQEARRPLLYLDLAAEPDYWDSYNDACFILSHSVSHLYTPGAPWPALPGDPGPVRAPAHHQGPGHPVPGQVHLDKEVTRVKSYD